MKKILTKLALTLIASILCINLAYANASDTAYTEAKKILDAMDTCEEEMEEYPIVIKLYETLELQGDEPDGEFRILDCYQHTIVNDPANKDIVKFTLSKTTWWDDCDDVTYKTVSYTHLTLPTIYSV